MGLNADPPRQYPEYAGDFLRHIWHAMIWNMPYEANMSNLKALRSLSDLGQNLRQARLARRFSIAELAIRADLSERTLIRLEKGQWKLVP